MAARQGGGTRSPIETRWKLPAKALSEFRRSQGLSRCFHIVPSYLDLSDYVIQKYVVCPQVGLIGILQSWDVSETPTLKIALREPNPHESITSWAKNPWILPQIPSSYSYHRKRSNNFEYKDIDLQHLLQLDYWVFTFCKIKESRRERTGSLRAYLSFVVS